MSCGREALAPQAAAFLAQAAEGLELADPGPAAVEPDDTYPVLFAGTLAELRETLPKLAQHPDLADLGADYPRAGGYVARVVRRQPAGREKGEEPGEQPVSLLVLGGDRAGAEKALTTLARVVTPARGLYSHWLPAHRP